MADQKILLTSPEGSYAEMEQKKPSDPEIAQVIHAENEDVDLKKDHMDFNRVDKEIAKYASDVAVDISPEDNSRLKRRIDKRVLSIMIFTYFLQALDKGTMSFASIMGLPATSI
jgi:hypothetical protein